MTPTFPIHVTSKRCTLDDLHTFRPSQYATSEERDFRFRMFKDALKGIDALNAAEKANNGTAIFGITAKSDYSPEELLSEVFTPSDVFKFGDDLRIAEVSPYQGSETSVDWTGIYTTPVKDQGNCLSGW